MIDNIFFLCCEKRLGKFVKGCSSTKNLYDEVFKTHCRRQVRRATFAHLEKSNPNFEVRRLIHVNLLHPQPYFFLDVLVLSFCFLFLLYYYFQVALYLREILNTGNVLLSE